MSDYGQPKVKTRRKGLLPVMGLIFAGLLVVVAYGVAPIALEAIGSFKADWDAKIRVNSDPSGELQTEFIYLMTLIVWLALMGLSMAIAAVAVGKDPTKESFKDIAVSPANRDALIKQMKRDLRDAKRRARKQGKLKK